MYSRLFALVAGILFSITGYTQTIEERLDALEEAVADDSGMDYSLGSQTSIGGYGELHYNGGNTTKDDQIDIHRFVIFLGHDYSDTVKFFSEFEIEHSIAGEGQPGEVEMEQMYVDVDYGTFNAKYGVFLIPIGILNETHEPDTFYGVERNGVEKNIIPSTWWEGGIMLSREVGEGLNIDAGIHSGMQIPDSGKVRSGRQKVGSAVNNDWAGTIRLKKTTPGLEYAFTYHKQTDAAQSQDDFNGLAATLMSGHMDYNKGPLSIQALYAEWDLRHPDFDANGKDKQNGYYLTFGYKVKENVGIFVRSEMYDTTAGDTEDSAVNTETFGVNYYIHPRVVLKLDFQNVNYDDTSKEDQSVFNLGFGFSY